MLLLKYFLRCGLTSVMFTMVQLILANTSTSDGAIVLNTWVNLIIHLSIGFYTAISYYTDKGRKEE